jgi:hypothetical protein
MADLAENHFLKIGVRHANIAPANSLCETFKTITTFVGRGVFPQARDYGKEKLLDIHIGGN